MPDTQNQSLEEAAYAGRVIRMTLEETAHMDRSDEALTRVTVEILRDGGGRPDLACTLTVSFAVHAKGRTMAEIQDIAFEHARKLLQYCEPAVWTKKS